MTKKNFPKIFAEVVGEGHNPTAKAQANAVIGMNFVEQHLVSMWISRRFRHRMLPSKLERLTCWISFSGGIPMIPSPISKGFGFENRDNRTARLPSSKLTRRTVTNQRGKASHVSTESNRWDSPEWEWISPCCFNPAKRGKFVTNESNWEIKESIFWSTHSHDYVFVKCKRIC